VTDALTDRQRQLNQAFVALADVLVQQFDVVDLLDRLAGLCVDVLGADSAGILVTDQHGDLQVMAATTGATQSLELFELQSRQGPCLDAFRTGRAVACTRIGDAERRWPRFAERARAEGISSVQALPMRLREQTIGGLILCYRAGPPMTDPDRSTAQALADVATIGILQHRALRRHESLSGQLQHALDSRLVIEQAKGKLAERGGIGVEQAFAALRGHARAHRRLLSDTARDLVDGTLDADAVLHAEQPTGGTG
jgi:transcriptional regulator with GAF, ATPase, and Fis domain